MELGGANGFSEKHCIAYCRPAAGHAHHAWETDNECIWHEHSGRVTGSDFGVPEVDTSVFESKGALTSVTVQLMIQHRQAPEVLSDVQFDYYLDPDVHYGGDGTYFPSATDLETFVAEHGDYHLDKHDSYHSLDDQHSQSPAPASDHYPSPFQTDVPTLALKDMGFQLTGFYEFPPTVYLSDMYKNGYLNGWYAPFAPKFWWNGRPTYLHLYDKERSQGAPSDAHHGVETSGQDATANVKFGWNIMWWEDGAWRIGDYHSITDSHGDKRACVAYCESDSVYPIGGIIVNGRWRSCWRTYKRSNFNGQYGEEIPVDVSSWRESRVERKYI